MEQPITALRWGWFVVFWTRVCMWWVMSSVVYVWDGFDGGGGGVRLCPMWSKRRV